MISKIMQVKHSRLLLIGTALIIAIFALFPVGPYRERNSYRCAVCFAKRDSFQWRFGSWPEFSMPLSKENHVISQTNFGEKFMPAHRDHQWEFAQGSPYYWGVRWGGCALGRQQVSQTFVMYETTRDFRDFIDEQIKSGSLSSNTLVAIVSDNSRWEATPVQMQGDELMDKFMKASEKWRNR